MPVVNRRYIPSKADLTFMQKEEEIWAKYVAEREARENEFPDIYQQSEQVEILKIREDVSIPSKVARHILTENNANFLISLNKYINLQKRKAEAKRQAETKEIDQSGFIINPFTTESYIVRALHNSPALHINIIIDKMESMGWKTNSKYNKYSYVSNELRKKYYMFDKVGKATFTLRNGVKCIKPIAGPSKKRLINKKAVSLKTIIANVVVKHKEFIDENNGATPKLLHHILQRIGYNISYSSVARAMR